MWSELLLLTVALQAALEQEAAVEAPRPARIEEGRDIVDLGVSPLELEAHVGYIAADERGGRDTGSEGEDEALRYAAARLEAAGWEPAGDDGFLQTVPLFVGRSEREPRLSARAAGEEFAERVWGVEFSVLDWRSLAGEFPLVVAEDSEALPEAAGAALFVPESASARRRLSAAVLEMEASERPALLLLRGPSSAGRPATRLARERLQRAEAFEGVPVLRLRGDLLEAVESGALEAMSVDLGYALEPRTSHNVVARLAGVGTPDDPSLADTAVVLSAHIDHLGVRPGDDPEADATFNGADDDASGVAVVLEVAEALAQGERPAREVLVLLATGEERGLLGSLHYLDQPATPLERTVYNLNFEMLGRPDALAGGSGQVWFTGFERTTVGPALIDAGIPLTPDPRPEQNFYERSDNIVFVMRGIPGQTLSSYDLHEDYHTPRDEWWRLDYEHMAAAAELSVRAARAIVDGRVPLDWSE